MSTHSSLSAMSDPGESTDSTSLARSQFYNSSSVDVKGLTHLNGKYGLQRPVEREP